MEAVRWDDLVQQPDAEGVLGADQVGRVEQVLRGGRPHKPDEPGRRRGRVDDAELGRGDPEPGAVRREPQVAGRGELAAAADAVALDRREHRLRERGERALRDRRQVGVVVAVDVAQLGDVGARAEVPARAGQHHDPDTGVGGQAVQDAGKRPPHGRGHRVALGRTVDHDRADAPRDLSAQPAVHRLPARRLAHDPPSSPARPDAAHRTEARMTRGKGVHDLRECETALDCCTLKEASSSFRDSRRGRFFPARAI